MTYDSAGAEARLRQLATRLRTLVSNPPAIEGEGRGLVIVAGGAGIFTNAYVQLHVLRHELQSRLSVELWYFGPEEISPAMAALLTPLDVTLVDATPIIARSGARITDGWQLKAFALANSGFAEVLLLDADQVPVRDPALVFEWPEYREHGAVFWPDVVDLRSNNPVWQMFGLEARREVSFESGQLLVDRRRHGGAVVAAQLLNEHSNDLYRLIYGDKDTFLLAWEVLQSPHRLVPHRPYSDQFALIQRDFDGRPLFQHRTNAKWQYGAEQAKVPGFAHEEACLRALAELRAAWGGKVFNPPDRSVRARAAELELISVGAFHLEPSDEQAIRLEFRPHAEIGEGRSVDRRNWWVEDVGGKLHLVISGGGLDGYRLTALDDGTWLGQRSRRPIVDVALMPAGTGTELAASSVPGLVDDLLRASGVVHGGRDALQQFAVAFDLLAKVLPGSAERLRLLAANQADPDLAAALERIAAENAKAPRPLRDFKLQDSFESGYVRAGVRE